MKSHAITSKAPLVALTGGGTAGHVMLHLALKDAMSARGWRLCYIGSGGIEKSLIEPMGIPFYTIKTGKLRRYLSLENIKDVFRVWIGIVQAFFILKKLKPSLLFSKGGYVSVPVAYAARMLSIPVITHESDLSPGLATKLIARVADRVFYSFPETHKFLPTHTSVYTGSPIRASLHQGDPQKALEWCGFQSQDTRPVLLVMGGSLGAAHLNQIVYDALPELLKIFRVIHVCGRGKKREWSASLPHSYCAFEYVQDPLKDLFALSSVVLSRAGANALFECLALKKPMVFVPLESGSRGDQVENAQSFVKKGYAYMLREAEMSSGILCRTLSEAYDRRALMQASMSKDTAPKSPEGLVDLLEMYLKPSLSYVV